MPRADVRSRFLTGMITGRYLPCAPPRPTAAVDVRQTRFEHRCFNGQHAGTSDAGPVAPMSRQLTQIHGRMIMPVES